MSLCGFQGLRWRPLLVACGLMVGSMGVCGAKAAGAVSQPDAGAGECPGGSLPWVALAPQVWMVPGEAGSPNVTNGGRVANLLVVRQGRRVWLVGSGPSLGVGAAVACEVRRRLGLPVSDVINPRAQPELVLGNAAFPRARIWAPAPVVQALQRHCPSCVESLARELGTGGEKLDARTVPLPQQQLHGPSGRLGPFEWQLLPRGGRSPTLVLHHRPTALWIAHGLLWAGQVPDLRDAELQALRDSTRSLLFQVGPDPIVGEQGGRTDASALREHLAYWEALEETVQSAVERGALEAAASEALALPQFAHLSFYAERHPLNVQRAWRQVEQAWFERPAR